MEPARCCLCFIPLSVRITGAPSDLFACGISVRALTDLRSSWNSLCGWDWPSWGCATLYFVNFVSFVWKIEGFIIFQYLWTLKRPFPEISVSPTHPCYNLGMLWLRANPRPFLLLGPPHGGWQKWSRICCILKHKKVRAMAGNSNLVGGWHWEFPLQYWDIHKSYFSPTNDT